MDLLTKTGFAKMLQGACRKIEAKIEELNKLDSATGDGDHGTSMAKAICAAAKSMTGSPADQPLKDALHETGWAIMGEDCGSTSTLFGSFFMGMSDAVDAEELSPLQTANMFAAGLAGIMKHTKAKIGDKTLMDALIPAVEAMQGKNTIAEMLNEAAAAAVKGAAATKELTAKFGRARNLGERSVGHVDAGAVSMSYIFAEFAVNA